MKFRLLFLSSSLANSLEEENLPTPLTLRPVPVARPDLHRLQFSGRESIQLIPRFEIQKLYVHCNRQLLHKAAILNSYNMKEVKFACQTLKETLTNYLQLTQLVDIFLFVL